MRSRSIAAALCVAATVAAAQSTPRQDAMLGGYFALWDSNASVTPDNVAKLYARRVIYYGHPMTRADLYRDKVNFVRRWPERRYRVEPGTASKRCDRAENTCVFSAVLSWRTADGRRGRSGRSRVSLTVAEDEGGMKIVKEGATTLAR